MLAMPGCNWLSVLWVILPQRSLQLKGRRVRKGGGSVNIPVWIIDDASIDPLLQDLKVRDTGSLGQVEAQLLGLAVPCVVERLVMEQAESRPSCALTFVNRSS